MVLRPLLQPGSTPVWGHAVSRWGKDEAGVLLPASNSFGIGGFQGLFKMRVERQLKDSAKGL